MIMIMIGPGLGTQARTVTVTRPGAPARARRRARDSDSELKAWFLESEARTGVSSRCQSRARAPGLGEAIAIGSLTVRLSPGPRLPDSDQ
eukprot:357952-Rhodomonas_salina.2